MSTINISKSKQFLILSVAFTACLLTNSLAEAQHYSSSNSKAIKHYERGIAELQKGNAAGMVDWMTKALYADSTFAEAALVLAEWHQDHNDINQACKYYYQAVRHHPTVHPQAYIELGNMELTRENYNEAKQNFEQFLARSNNKDKKTAALHGMEIADFRIAATSTPVPFEPHNMGEAVNGPYDDYLPALTIDASTLIFTRRFPRKATTTANTAEEEDFFISHKVKNRWQPATRMSEPVNSTDNEGAQCISPDGRLMFFTACGRKDGAGRCDLYFCVRSGNKWTKPRNVGLPINSAAWESQPTISPDGKTLYFVSNRKGGYGGMDIWKSEKVNGRWSEPVNLGETINTPGDEMTPFLHSDGKTLYFSSNGHVGMGGFDMFMAQLGNDGEWSAPKNLGYPINTSADESGLVVSASGLEAFYSSNRADGYGKQDIYSFELPPNVRPIPTGCMKGKLYDASTQQTISGEVTVIDVENGVVVSISNVDIADGEYMAALPIGKRYAINAMSDGYLFYSQHVDFSSNEATSNLQTMNVDIAMEPIVMGSSIVLNNIFFETGKYELLPESNVELERIVVLLKQNTNLKVEIAGHTDNIGKPEDNKTLSKQRAEAVLNYLISHGIEPTRLSSTGYGDTNPIADNKTEEGRKQNRRTELKVK